MSEPVIDVSGTDATHLPTTRLRGSSDSASPAVRGENTHLTTEGFVAGKDPVFGQASGVYGSSAQLGVFGHGTGDTATGVLGQSAGAGTGVRGESTSGAAVLGHSFGSGPAGSFIGDVTVEGTITVSADVVVRGDVKLLGGDVAENFDLLTQAPARPGEVMVLTDGGGVRPSDQAYDRRVAGVVSGAGTRRPGVVLREDGEPSPQPRAALAMTGTVWCLADATSAPIEVGDLLTTSSTPGHAMRADDPLRAFGAVLGKAMGALPAGRGLVPVLVGLA